MVAIAKNGGHQSDSSHSGPEEAESQEWWKTFVNFQGCWLMPPTAKDVSLVQAQFQPRPDDIILATFPKCGTTWLKALAFTVANRSRHPVTGDNHPLLTHNPHDLVPFLEMPDRSVHPVTELEELASPRLLGTHVPLELLPSGTLTLGCRVVYLCREPKDVLVSLWYHIQNLHQDLFVEFDKAFELFCKGVSFFGPLWKHYLGYWKQSIAQPDNVLFLKYDEMIAEPTKHVKMLAEFLHVPFTSDEESSGVVEEIVRLCSFENLKSLPVNRNGMAERFGGGVLVKNSLYFRNGKVGDWTNHMTKEMQEKLDYIIQEELKGSGLTF